MIRANETTAKTVKKYASVFAEMRFVMNAADTNATNALQRSAHRVSSTLTSAMNV